MALPRLNDTPNYSIKIPSLNKNVKFRPFLVKEQKILLLALESQDQKQIFDSIINTIEACAQDKININAMTSYDIEYVFTKIRAQSIGETSEIVMKCEKCESDTKIKVNLNNIVVTDNEIDNKIDLENTYTLVMKYPTYNDINMLIPTIDNTTPVDQLYSSIIMCMDKLLTEDESINMNDEPHKEKEEFLDSLNSAQFEKIINFVNNMPTVTLDADFKCEVCHEENKRTLNGIQDFF